LSDLQSAGFDPESLWERVDGDLDLLRDLTRIFQEEFPAIMGRAEAAIQRGDAAGLAQSGHKIKGSLLQFSAPAGAAAAQGLEELGRSGRVAGAETLMHTLRHEVEVLMSSLNTMAGRIADQFGGERNAEKGRR
jgi:HPt (histidine-containing phosphotransfer) domain-containing protein